MRNVKTNVLIRDIKEILNEVPGLTTDNHGGYRFKIYTDYNDQLSKDQIASICESEDQENSLCEVFLYEVIEDGYYFYVLEELGEIQETVIQKLEEKHAPLTGRQAKIVRELVEELVYPEYPLDHFLKQEVEANIWVDTGDGDNYGFTLNDRYPSFWGKDEGEIDARASIRWLSETQGYSEPVLRAALSEGDCDDPKTFLESLRVELANASYPTKVLVILARMTVHDLIRLNQMMKGQKVDGKRLDDATLRPDCGSIHIGKNATLGLYDAWNGSGGPFEILLEKDFNLPVKFVHSALPDGKYGRWSVEHTYGMLHSEWKECVSFL